MDKIKYILALTNIKMTDDTKKQIKNRLRTAVPDMRARKVKKIKTVAGIVTLSVIGVAAVVFCLFFVIPKLKENPGGHVSIDPAPVTAAHTTSAPETTVITDPVVYQTEFKFNILYTYADEYRPFRMAGAVMSPTSDGSAVILGESLYPLSDLFGTSDADALCRTLFAFYEDGTAIRFDKMPESNNEEIQKLTSQFALTSRLKLHREELIVAASRNGTFEYLLTFTVLVPGEYTTDNQSNYSGEDILNTRGEFAGYFNNDNSISILADRLTSLDANIYKIRFEAGVPVIYQKIAVSSDDYYGVQSPYSSTATKRGGFSFTDFIFTTASFDVSLANTVIFNPTENAMLDVTCTEKNYQPDAFIYSYPSGYGSGEISRKQVCDIINKFNLQWFFPYYIEQNMTGTKIIGSGISALDPFFSIASLISSSSDAILYGDSFSSNAVYRDVMSGELNGAFYYNPTLCDRPYFNITALNKGGLPLFEFDLVNDTVRKLDTVKDALNEEKGELKLKSDDGFEFYYTFMSDRKGIKPRAATGYSADLLPFCQYNDVSFDNNELAKRLDFRQKNAPVFRADGMSYNDYVIMTRPMYASGVDTDTLDSVTAANGEQRNIALISAYQRLGDYILDVKGEVCGAAVNDGVAYIFDTAIPYTQLLTVTTEDGYLLYMGPADELAVCSMITADEFDRYERIEGGTFMGTLVHAAELFMPDFPVYYAKHEGHEAYVTMVSVYSEPVSLPVRYGENLLLYRYLGGRLGKHVYEDVSGYVLTGELYYYEQSPFVFFSENENEVILAASPEWSGVYDYVTEKIPAPYIEE